MGCQIWKCSQSVLCRLLNIDDLQNAELWQKAGLLTADQNDQSAQQNSKLLQATDAIMQQALHSA